MDSDYLSSRNLSSLLHQGLSNVGWENLVSALDAHAIIAVTDRRGVITYVNDKFCAISGYSREELVGKTHKMVNSDYHLPDFWKNFWTTIKRGKIWSGAICNRAKKGSIYWVQTTIYPVVDENGQVTNYLALRTEMTQLKEAEARMRESEQRWHFALEGNGDGVWDWDLESGEIFFSARWIELVGCDPKDVGNDINELKSRIHPDDWKHWHSCLGRSVDRPFEIEHRTRRGDGSYFWSITRGKVVDWDRNGKPLRIIGTLRDESERRAVLSRLEESESQFREAFENTRIGTALVALDGTILKANGALCQILGYSELELKALTFQEVAHGDDRMKDDLLRQETIEGKRSFYRLQKRYLTKSGRTIWTNLNVVIARLANGTPRHFVAQVEDITELVYQKEELTRLAARAEEANRAKSDFLANMSHEIRTPMNGVLGMASLLLDSNGLSDEQRRQAELIRSSGQALLGVINDILDISKIESGKFDLEKVEFELMELLDELNYFLEEQATRKGLAYHCNVNMDTVGWLKGDPGRLRQVILNLVSNAVKFTDKGSVRLDVALQSAEKGKALVRFSVKDTGIGIRKEVIGQLFTKFTQADSSTTRVYGGTGLGLAICKSLVELMDGEIGVESIAGEGSEFWFTINFDVATGGSRGRMRKMLEGKSALILTDDEQLMKVLEDRLDNWSISSGLCVKVSTAVRLLRERRESGLSTHYVIYDRRIGDEGLSVIDDAIAMSNERGSPRLIVMGGDRLTELASPNFTRISLKPRQSELFNALIEGEKLAGRSDGIGSELRFLGDSEKSMRILVAEDNLINQLVVLGMLEKFGLSADSVSNGSEALKALEKFRYDVVLMDIQMPEMDGLEATRRIRNGEAGKDISSIPIVGLTAHARQQDRKICIDSGMTRYLSKPISPEQLFEVLNQFFGESLEREVQDKLVEAGSQNELEEVFLDVDRLLRDTMGDENLAKRIARSAIGQLEEAGEVLSGLYESGDIEELSRKAHSLKGASAVVGCLKLKEVAYEIERFAKEDDREELACLLEQLQSVLWQTIYSLRAFVGEGFDLR